MSCLLVLGPGAPTVAATGCVTVVNNEEKRRNREFDRVGTLTVTYLRGDLGYWRLRS